MAAPALKPGRDEIVYPESDGEPIADNTLQFEWITTIKGGLDNLFRDDLSIFVAGDLLWYPVQGDNTIRTAPDVLVAVGRQKGYRGSYLQWEEGNVAPQVVFEILSPGNRLAEMGRKFEFYERYGVEEYYLYDPYRYDLTGWVRASGGGDHLRLIDPIQGWTSPRLGIRFEAPGDRDLTIFRPDGELFATYLEICAQRNRDREERRRAEQERDAAQERAEKLATRLRELGVDPDAV